MDAPRPVDPTVWPGYDPGMTKKRTFSLPDDVSDQIDRVAAGNASAYVAAAVRDKLARDSAAAAIRAAYGEPDPTAYQYWIQHLTPDQPDQAAHPDRPDQQAS